jgi:hypothetical protein
MAPQVAETRRTIAVFLVLAMLGGAMLVLLGTGGTGANAQSTECGGSSTPSPVESSASPSPSDSGGGLPTLPDIPPGEESSAPPSESPSGSPTDGGGSTIRCPSTLTIAYDDPAFKGAIKSPESQCKGGRTVKVFEERGDKDRVVGSAVTNGRGKWREPYPQAAGERYYAKTRKSSQLQENGDKLVCAGDKSKTIRAGTKP